MKRTNLVLDENLMEEVVRVYGEKTYSAAINRAMADAIRMSRLRDLHGIFGKIEWAGDLSEMREDHASDEPWLKSDSAKLGK